MYDITYCDSEESPLPLLSGLDQLNDLFLVDSFNFYLLAMLIVTTFSIALILKFLFKKKERFSRFFSVRN